MLEQEAQVLDSVKSGLARAAQGLQIALHSDLLDAVLEEEDCAIIKTELACKQALIENIRLMGRLSS